jgi:ferritin-like protein
MFAKYASNLLQGIQEECILKALASKNKEDANEYYKIAERINNLINNLPKE